MAKNINTGDKNLAKVEGALTKSEQFIEKNQKNITRVFVITLAVIFIIYGYKKYYSEPKMTPLILKCLKLNTIFQLIHLI